MGEKNPHSLQFGSKKLILFCLFFMYFFIFLLLKSRHDLSDIPGSVFAAR